MAFQNIDCNQIDLSDLQHALLDDPCALLRNPKQSFRSKSGAEVVQTQLVVSAKTLPVVIKREKLPRSVPGILKSLQKAKSLRNLRTTCSLHSRRIPVVRTLAALWKRRGPCIHQSLYVTEYLPDSRDLFHFLRENLSNQTPPRVRRELAKQLAHIFAGLENAHLYHRDAKAQNLLVLRDTEGQWNVLLLDVDGIRRRGIGPEKTILLSMAKLASTLLGNDKITKTDYYRTFTFFCRLSKIPIRERKSTFMRLATQAVAMRLRVLADSVIKQSKGCECNTREF